MKRLSLLLFTLVLMFSCSKDNEDPVQPCNISSNLQVSNITHNSATISWQNNNTSTNVILEYGETGFTLGTGIQVNLNGTSYTVNNLNANTTYNLYVTSNCGNDNLSNSAQISFTTLQPPVVAEFMPNLSQLNLFVGDLENLTPSNRTYNYDLITPLFTDYAYKQRLIAMPSGTSMTYQDDGLPTFPDNTVIAKTFYYNVDERNESLGKIIIETRILIKQNGVWETGNYKWNVEQTDATYTMEGSIVNTTYIDQNGITQTLDYEIPSNTDCFQCHNINNIKTPIGPKLRTMNFNNQLEELIESGLLTNISSPSSVATLPNWEDDMNFNLEERARAYFDVNCAHCHQPGGSCSNESNLDLRYETRFSDTFIYDLRYSIFTRMNSNVVDYSMPLIGTTMIHEEGVNLINDYVDSL